MLDIYKREAEIKAAYGNVLDQIAIDKKEFAKKQAQDLKMFNLKLNERRAKAHSSILMEMAMIKQNRRNTNETYNDRLGETFSIYNAERKADGEQPIMFDNALHMVEEERGNKGSPFLLRVARSSPNIGELKIFTSFIFKHLMIRYRQTKSGCHLRCLKMMVHYESRFCIYANVQPPMRYVNM